MKDEGKREVMKDIENEFSNDLIKVSEVWDLTILNIRLKKFNPILYLKFYQSRTLQESLLLHH